MTLDARRGLFVAQHYDVEIKLGISTDTDDSEGNVIFKSALKPNEDEIIVFPSKTFHSTSPSKSDNERISISADISVICTFISKV